MSKRSSLVTQHLERIDREALEEYQNGIRLTGAALEPILVACGGFIKRGAKALRSCFKGGEGMKRINVALRTIYAVVINGTNSFRIFTLLLPLVLLVGCGGYHKANMGTVMLDTRPPGATVSYGGDMLGKSPVSFEVDWSKYKDLLISLDGYYPEREIVDLQWLKRQNKQGNLHYTKRHPFRNVVDWQINYVKTLTPTNLK